ncbi:hypothetical protein C0992_013155 [Termitomyces sp. T32_za158]|nr:hypothetical protein C0992_013155 [Termitomyces sp. T32_za158]
MAYNTNGSTRSNLLILLGHPDPELVFLAYSENSYGSQLTATKQLSLYERTPRPAEFFTDIVVHPSGKVAVVSCYVGKLRIVKLKAGNYEEDFDVVLRELNLLGLEFLPLQEDEYALAILHIDCQERVQLLSRDILLEDLELSSSPSIVLTPTVISNKVVPYPDEITLKLFPVQPQSVDSDVEEDCFLGGLLVIGGRKIVMYELASSQGQAKQRSKRRRLEKKKKSIDAADVEEARIKEKEREGRARKVHGSVVWPWSEVTAENGVGPNAHPLEISAVSCAPLDPVKPYTNRVVVSYWETRTVEIFAIEPRGLISEVKTPPLPAFAKSVLLHDFSLDKDNHHYYLLAGLSDGTVAYFSWKDKKLSDSIIVPLGHIPVSLSACKIDGKQSVFAASNRATVFSWEKKRLHNSPIMLRVKTYSV